jgi:plasmid stabilization system protein ParE
MKRYRVEFTDEAKRDINESYEWGCREWGDAKAFSWYRASRAKTREILTHFPLSQPVARESTEAGTELRQIIFGRYRILFEIEKRTVREVHVQGAFVDKKRSGQE